MPKDDLDIRHTIARAFERAWEPYYQSVGRAKYQDLARTELARRLVQLSREGERDETRLAEAGLQYLKKLRETRAEAQRNV